MKINVEIPNVIYVKKANVNGRKININYEGKFTLMKIYDEISNENLLWKTLNVNCSFKKYSKIHINYDGKFTLKLLMKINVENLMQINVEIPNEN